MTGPDNSADAAARSFIPDLCASRHVFFVVLIAQLVAIILTLAHDTSVFGFWPDLARTSLLILWIALPSAVVVCAARPQLARLPTARASLLCILLLVATAAVVTEGVYQLAHATGFNSFVPADHFGFLLRTLGISAIVSAMLLRYFYVAHQWRSNVESRARAHVAALQARIRPHFLFNSMNTIAALTRSDPAKAEEAVEDLADLFRANLTEKSGMITLREEFEVARIYQRIEQLRLGERLRVRWDVGELPMSARVPGLTVQPLLENAIYHGIEPLPGGGEVTITGTCDAATIRLSVSNPLPDADLQRHEGNRIALSNIEQRLSLAYESRGRLEVESAGGSYTATLVFPRVED